MASILQLEFEQAQQLLLLQRSFSFLSAFPLQQVCLCILLIKGGLKTEGVLLQTPPSSRSFVGILLWTEALLVGTPSGQFKEGG